jgi:hypothetical protein
MATGGFKTTNKRNCTQYQERKKQPKEKRNYNIPISTNESVINI